jgi:DNA-binding GntR family transcriptional regulator
MDKSKQNTLSDQTYQLIKNEIVTCVLDPGQVIVQADLAEKYKTGITPVREALRQLAQEGFIQSIPRMGYIVSPITPQDVNEIYELRLILETAAVRLAATRGSNKALEHIADLANFTYTYKDRHSYSSFLKRNAEFHISIADSTLNQRLVNQISKTMDELSRVFHLGLDLKDSAEEMRKDHLKLAEALCRRDADLAGQLTQEEIVHSRDRVLEALRVNIMAFPLLMVQQVNDFPKSVTIGEK